MSNDVTKAEFVLTAGEAPKVNVDGVLHTFDTTTGNLVAGTEVITGEKLTQALTKGFEEAGKRESLAAHEFEQLSGMATAAKNSVFKGSQAGADAIKFIEEAAPVRQAFITEDAAAIGKHMVEGGASVKYIPHGETMAFYDGLGKEGVTAFERSVDNAKGLADKIKGATFSGKTTAERRRDLRGAMSEFHTFGEHHKTKLDINEIKGMLPDSVSEHLNAKGFSSIDQEIASFVRDSQVAHGNLTNMAHNRIPLVADLAKAEKKWRGKDAAVKAANEAIAAHDKRVLEFIGEDAAHGNAFHNLPPSVKNTLESSTSIKSGLTDALKGVGKASDVAKDAEKGAKWLRGGKLLDFKYTAETAGKDVAKIEKFRYAKAGILAGMVLVTGAIIAKVANSTGPGENAERVAARRENQAAQGIA